MIQFSWSSRGIDLMKQLKLESNMKSLKDDKEEDFEKLLSLLEKRSFAKWDKRVSNIWSKRYTLYKIRQLNCIRYSKY